MQHYSREQLVDALAPTAVARPAWANWARTFHAVPRALFHPPDVHHARLALELATRDARVLRPVGIGHSPSDVACTTDYMLNITALNRVLEVNVEECYVVAQAGITLTDLHAALAQHGLAMRNLGSISDQTLAGIIATATHGSGVNFGVMSTHVLALTTLAPDNTIRRCSPTENRDLFEATVCGIGATGLILDIKLEVEPAFRLREVHSLRPFGDVVRDLDTIKHEGEHVRLWWFPALGTVRCMVSSRTQEPPTSTPSSWFWCSPLLGFFAFHAVQLLLLLSRYAPRSCSSSASASPNSSSSPSTSSKSASSAGSTPSRSWPTPTRTLQRLLAPLTRPAHVWAARLACWLAPAARDEISGEGGVLVDDSVRVFNVECRYPQHTTEWALPSTRAAECLTELGAWLEAEEARGDEGERPHFPIEIRFSAADALWLSPSSGGETCWIGIVQYKPYNLPTRYHALFAAFEAILTRHGGRPHWAKAHHLDARAVRRLYPDFGKFLGVVREVDPEGTFRNEYMERHLLGAPGGSDGREYKAFAASPRSSSSSSTSSSTPTTSSRSSSSLWSWIWPQTRKPQPTPPTPTWRTDWRLAPPAEEVAREKERRRRAVAWLDEEEGGDSPTPDDGVESDENENGSSSSSDESESTLAGSELLASHKVHDLALAAPDIDADADSNAKKHPARTLVGVEN
ncbi:D-arabinono-1,4-lactone oxidase-domain-containing protein [Mycena albidolilacea]|uniref:D-arabinono-1,4-lactone oxidase n=1 Tax=Mycena albidolilacea TaxID=1033008 RepID=A0AAD7EVP2_9AGAR|nr:D-arabinono-1,4-lactone oxidase-domain-containing protein [Mycena albidolilacea]